MSDVFADQPVVDHVRLMSATRKMCRWCSSEMQAQAVFCSECKNHQSIFREITLYFASITGVLTLLISGLAFAGSVIASHWDGISGLFWARKVAVIEYLAVLPNQVTNVVIANSSSKPIFVASISMKWQGRMFSAIFQKTIAPKEFSTLSKEQITRWDYKGVVGTFNGNLPDLPADAIDVD
jgi:hypothetical protein